MSTYFIFNNSIYKQTFGTPMRSPLSPIIADIVIQALENYTLNELKLDLLLYMENIWTISHWLLLLIKSTLFSTCSTVTTVDCSLQLNMSLIIVSVFLFIFKKNG